jgi:hypothetical protein
VALEKQAKKLARRTGGQRCTPAQDEKVADAGKSADEAELNGTNPARVPLPDEEVLLARCASRTTIVASWPGWKA